MLVAQSREEFREGASDMGSLPAPSPSRRRCSRRERIDCYSAMELNAQLLAVCFSRLITWNGKFSTERAPLAT